MFKYETMLRYSKVNGFNEGLATYYDSLEHTWKILDKNGNERKIVRNYSQVSSFSEGKAAVQDENGLWGYIDKNGEEVIPCRFKTAERFVNGFAIVSNNTGLYAYINVKGEEITPYMYDHLNYFSGGFALAETRDSSGKAAYTVIDDKGEPMYVTRAYVERFTEGIALIKRKVDNYKDEYGFFDLDGNLINGTWYVNARCFNQGLAPVKDKETGLWGYIDKSGTLKHNFQYTFAASFENNGKAQVTKKYPSVTVNKDGKVIIGPEEEFRYAIDFCGNETPIKSEVFDVNIAEVSYRNQNGWIFVDNKGNIVSKKIYSSVGYLSEGLARVVRKGKCGFVNSHGQEVIRCQYDGADYFNGGLAMVTNGKGLQCAIDKTGKEVIPCKYVTATGVYSDFSILRDENNLHYVIDNEGKIIISSKPGIRYDSSEEVFTIYSDFDLNDACYTEIVGFSDRSGKTIKDLSQHVFVKTFKIGDVEKVLVAETEEGLRDLILSEIRMYERMLNASMSGTKAVKSIGVYPGTEQPKA